MTLLPLRTSDLGPTRRGVAAVGVASLALSFLLSIAPVIASNGNGNANSGTVKIHLADGTPLPESSTDPHVCSFRIGFYYATDTSGAWHILAWPEGTTELSGTFTTNDGLYITDGVIALEEAGHYRLNWQGTGEQTWKHKMFWVDGECFTPTDPDPLPDTDGTGGDDGTGGGDGSDGGEGNEGSDGTDGGESGQEINLEIEPIDDGQGNDGDDGSDGNDGTGPDSTPSDPSEPSEPTEPVMEDHKSGSSAPTPSSPPQPGQPGENAAPGTDTGGSGANEAVAPAGSGGDAGTPDKVPDTGTPPPVTGFLTAAGLLLVVGAHRLRLPDRRTTIA